MLRNLSVDSVGEQKAKSQRNVENYLSYVAMILSQPSFQNLLLLEEAESFEFQDQSTHAWRQHPFGSSVRARGAANEAAFIFAAQNRFGTASDAPEDNRAIFGFSESK